MLHHINNTLCCNNVQVTKNSEGFMVCSNCGTVLSSLNIDLSTEERRNYSYEESLQHKRTEIIKNTFSNHRTTFNSWEFKASKTSVNFARLARLDRSTCGRERNLCRAYKKFQTMSPRLELPDIVFETAWRIYVTSADNSVCRGRTIETVLGVSIYIACRIHNCPQISDHIVHIIGLDFHSFSRTLSYIVRNIIPQLKYKFLPLSPNLFIYKFGNSLNISFPVQLTAVNLLQKARKRGFRCHGIDPKGIACAALYLSSNLHKKCVTQMALVLVSDITETTIRSRLKEILKHLSDSSTILA